MNNTSVSTAVSAVVYIWYQDGENIGHASMYIGDPVVGKIIEAHYDSYIDNRSRQEDWAFIELHNVNYVSWWPLDSAGFFDKLKQERKFFLEDDISAEGTKPHVIYKLHGLDVQAMRSAWLAIRSKPNAHYQLLRKSCATVVLRVLKAGGATQKLPLHKRAWLSNNLLFVTPKNIAQICNELRADGFSQKSKSEDCPKKGAFSFGIFR